MANRKAYLIDVETQEVRDVEIDESDPYTGVLEQYYKLLKCDTIDVVRVDRDHVVYVDDEGLLKEKRLGYFQFGEGTTVLPANGLLVGTKTGKYGVPDGEDYPPSVPIDVVRKTVKFYRPGEVAAEPNLEPCVTPIKEDEDMAEAFSKAHSEARAHQGLCYWCQGVGKLETETCSRCKGSGKEPKT